MKTIRCLLLSVLLLSAAGCIGPNRPPHAVMPPIVEEYHSCEKCGSLHGGIYGKGPLASFATNRAASCWHRWVRMDKAKFQQEAALAFPGEWAKAPEFIRAPVPR